MKKSIITLLTLLVSAGCLFADESGKLPLDVAFDARVDYALDMPVGDDAKNSSGIHGRYLNVMLNGNILPNLSYAWRQRLNKFQDLGNDVFAATDWLYLKYNFADHWDVSAGKQVVMIGGYEYDAAPIDIIFASRFWNNIACYQFGGSVTYTTPNGNHAFSAQVCNSPYTAQISTSCYAYNLFWAGKMGCYQTLWSVNLIEYERGKYANFIALGNRLTLDNVDIQLDLMNRATRHHKFIAGDYSVIGKITYDIRPWISVFAKGGYDEFKIEPQKDQHVDNPFYGGGFEFYPMKHGSRDLRIHAVWDRTSDNDGNKVSQVSIGLKWRVNLYSRK